MTSMYTLLYVLHRTVLTLGGPQTDDSVESRASTGRLRNPDAFDALFTIFVRIGPTEPSAASSSTSMAVSLATAGLKLELRTMLLNQMLAILCGHPDNYRLCAQRKRPIQRLVEMLQLLPPVHQTIVIKVTNSLVCSTST